MILYKYVKIGDKNLDFEFQTWNPLKLIDVGIRYLNYGDKDRAIFDYGISFTLSMIFMSIDISFYKDTVYEEE